MEEKLLEEFRKEWKKEIDSERTRSVSRIQKSETNVSLSSMKRTNSEECAKNDGNKIVTRGDDSSSSVPNSIPVEERKSNTSKKSTLQPFLIAEHLLGGKSVEESLSYSDVAETSKRKQELREELFVSRNKRLKVLSGETSHCQKSKSDTLLDILIADLDEITEIPFFDTEIPREVAIKIFYHLTAIELCRCSQVSRAWKSLADDELLWSTICHKLGYEESTSTVEQTHWKEIVKQHIFTERQLQQNWKTRTGDIQQLQYVKGGVLCAATSHGSLVAAGYSNGDVRLWSLEEENGWTLQPSNTALALDEDSDMGTITNSVVKLAINHNYTLAAYQHGNVDVWLNSGSTKPIHSVQCTSPVSGLALASDNPIFAVQHGNLVTTEALTDGENFTKVSLLQMEEMVRKLHLVPNVSHPSKVTSPKDWSLVITLHDEVRVHNLGADPGHMTSLHHVALQTISAVDCSKHQVAVAVTNVYDPDTMGNLSRVRVYDLGSGRESSSHLGYSTRLNVLNLADSPPHSFVTGGWDRKVRLYDTRLGEPVSIFHGHGGPVTCVQMDDVKVVSAATEGLVCVWDQRMANKLWELHNRHPVEYSHFTDTRLITANIPANKTPENTEFDSMLPRRHRGALHVYDFTVTQETQGIPEVCQSTYDQPEGYSYNIRLTMPYDTIS